MRKIFYKNLPADKNLLTLALESGIDGVLCEAGQEKNTSALAKITVWTEKSVQMVTLKEKADEQKAAKLLQEGKTVVLTTGWEIIPVENLLAQKIGAENLVLEVASLEEARLAVEILERGVQTVLVLPQAVTAIKNIVSELKVQAGKEKLDVAKVLEVTPVGMGHRVCVDTLSMLDCGEGMLVGNSSAFTFLVHGETEHSEYVASRPFRINAGAVHAYAVMPNDTTAYLSELQAGTDILVVNAKGDTKRVVVGRVKVEQRPMLLIRAKVGEQEGAVFLQNAETIRVVSKAGLPVSVVDLKAGDEILCKVDVAGRHFGMRIEEDIKEK